LEILAGARQNSGFPKTYASVSGRLCAARRQRSKMQCYVAVSDFKGLRTFCKKLCGRMKHGVVGLRVS